MSAPLLLSIVLAAAGVVPDLGEPRVVLEVPWGSGGTMLGRVDGNESSPEGPMSFAVAPEGDIYVLDQLSSRVVHFDRDGRFVTDLPLPANTFQDIEALGDGRLVVLDRLVRRTVLVLDEPTGDSYEIEFMGEGIPEGGAVTALLAREDGVWLEVAHTTSVRVLDENLAPCDRTVVRGRPSAIRGRTLGAALDPATGAASIAITERDERRVHVTHTEPISRIAWLEDDADGNVVIAFHVMRFDESGLELDHEYDGGRVYGPDGAPQAVFRSRYVITEWEQVREFDVTDDGSIYQMAFTPEGVKVLQWSVPIADRRAP